MPTRSRTSPTSRVRRLGPLVLVAALAVAATAASWRATRRRDTRRVDGPATVRTLSHSGQGTGDVPAAPGPSRDPGPSTRFGRWYGAPPLHLLVLAVSLTLTASAVSLLARSSDVERIAIWFVAAVVAHDLVLFPLYALADRSVSVVLGWRAKRRRRFSEPAINYLRTPVLASALLLLVFFPSIIGQGARTYEAKSGLTPGSMYLDRWLLLTGGFFLVSAICYAARSAVRRRRAR